MMGHIGLTSDFEPVVDEVAPKPQPPDSWVQRHGPAVGLLVGLAVLIETLARGLR